MALSKFYTLKEFSEKYNIPMNRLRLQSQSVQWKREKIFRCKLLRTGRPRIGIYANDIAEYFAFAKELEQKKYANGYIKINNTIPEYDQWTKSSIICYLNNLDCTACPNWEIACKRVVDFLPQDKPPIKTVTMQLYRDLGKPPIEMIRNVEEIA